MVRLLALLLILSAGIARAETPDPKPLVARVESLEARVRYLESLLMPVPTSTPTLPDSTPTTTTTTFSQTCTGPNCSTANQSFAPQSSGWYLGKRFGR